jgi:hypothetical protein
LVGLEAFSAEAAEVAVMEAWVEAAEVSEAVSVSQVEMAVLEAVAVMEVDFIHLAMEA